jgi:DNA-binding transcriptional regulator PaaX
MTPRNEELLYVLLWTADTLMRPTWRNLNDSFEQWAWRNRLSRRLAELERQKFIERHPEPDLERVVRLTAIGRRLALGGRDPMTQWSRTWDGLWRMVLFDLPVHRTNERQQLLRVLRRNQFGYLQKSVWITPDAAVAVTGLLGEAKVQPDAFLIIESRPAAGETDAEIVDAAWDFAEINRRYDIYERFVKQLPRATALAGWARRENALWKAAVNLDPMLPIALLPAGYRGREALQARKRVFAQLAGSKVA